MISAESASAVALAEGLAACHEAGVVHGGVTPGCVLAQRGAGLAREPVGGHGPVTGLLDQVVLEVSDGQTSVGIALRTLFALTGMGFARDKSGRSITESSALHDIADDEPVRVRASATWIRLDARFGAVYQRRGDQFAVTVL